MRTRGLTPDALERALSVRDLTDPAEGPHAMQQLVAELRAAISLPMREKRGSRVVSVADNYYDLGVPREGVTLDACFVGAESVLRTHMTSVLPRALRELAMDDGWTDLALVSPGIVYRRDAIGPAHASEPHQVDVWRLRRGMLTRSDLHETVSGILRAILPGLVWRMTDASAPYALGALQIDVEDSGRWIEVGECGLAHPKLLAMAGLASEVSAFGMGFGVDRALMLRKGIPDIRLLRADDPRVRSQMMDLEPYRAVPSMPAVERELSLETSEELEIEELGDRVRVGLAEKAASIEEISVIAETPCATGRKSVTLRVVIRDLDRPLSDAEVSDVLGAIEAALREG